VHTNKAHRQAAFMVGKLQMNDALKHTAAMNIAANHMACLQQKDITRGICLIS
jgi:hypothetical protein